MPFLKLFRYFYFADNPWKFSTNIALVIPKYISIFQAIIIRSNTLEQCSICLRCSRMKWTGLQPKWFHCAPCEAKEEKLITRANFNPNKLCIANVHLHQLDYFIFIERFIIMMKPYYAYFKFTRLYSSFRCLQIHLGYLIYSNT